jgi:hypothetical protein
MIIREGGLTELKDINVLLTRILPTILRVLPYLEIPEKCQCPQPLWRSLLNVVSGWITYLAKQFLLLVWLRRL